MSAQDNMEKRIKRIFDLVRQTGDRVIVFDGSTDEAFVVMDLDSYESIIQAKSSPQPDHTSQMAEDLALWENTQKNVIESKDGKSPLEQSEPLEGVDTQLVKVGDREQEPDENTVGEKYYFEEIEAAEDDKQD